VTSNGKKSILILGSWRATTANFGKAQLSNFGGRLSPQNEWNREVAWRIAVLGAQVDAATALQSVCQR